MRSGEGSRRRTALAASVVVVLAVALGAATFVYARIGGGPVGGRPAVYKTVAPGTGDYAQVYDAVAAAWLRSYHASGAGGQWMVDQSLSLAVPAGPYTTTNVQVPGVEAGDVVKTDGRTIFVACGQRVALVAASGADTAALGAIDITAAYTPRPTEDGPDTVLGDVVDLLLAEDRLVVVANDYSQRPRRHWSSDEDDVELVAEQTLALVYDVADPADPVFVTSLGQSGAHTTSRLRDGVLHLVSDHMIESEAPPDPDDPMAFLPLLFDGAGIEPLPVADIALFPSPSDPRFAVASAIDVATGVRLAQQAVLGGAEMVHLSDDNLYLVGRNRSQQLAVPEATLAAIGLADTTGVHGVTHVARLSLSGLTVAAEATLPGHPVTQFAFDEHDGNLRTVWNLSAYRDSTRTIQASLVVLDADLEVVGSIADLVGHETVKSARFLGTVVHVVTSGQTDLLFSVDVSDPARPVVHSPVQITGFSNYLHPWSDGLLLGAGLSGGWLYEQKISMYDTSDPFSVRQAATLEASFSWSEAMFDHRAILVDAEHGIFGFPAGFSDDQAKHYLVYRYDAGQLSLSLDLEVDQGDGPGEDSKGSPVRGLLVADDLYVASADAVSVHTLGGARLATVRL